jgi:hypothetical protein
MPVSPGTNLTAAQLSLALNPRIGTFTGDSDLAGAAYGTEANVDQVTVNVISGYTYRIKWVFQYAVQTSGTNALTIKLKAGTAASGNQLTYMTTGSFSNLTPSNPFTLEADWTASVTGSQTFSGTATRTTGSTNSQFKGATSMLRSLTVEYVAGA